jgi:NodT family efflux transporter outer membrane factor (OMF) lipoprotein
MMNLSGKSFSPLWMMGWLCAAFLAACTVGPNYHQPPTTMPEAFAPPPPTTRPVATAATRPVDMTRWWQSLDDPELDSLINRAVANNPDLEIALARLQEARTQEAAVSGSSLPAAEFSGGAARGSGTNSVNGRIAHPEYAGTNTTGLKQITQAFGFDAGWDLDFFGGYRRQIEAARYDTQAAAEARNDVLILLLSDVARAFIDQRTMQMSLAIAQSDIDAEQKSYDLVHERFVRGFTNELDDAIAKRELAAVEAQVAPIQAAIAADDNRLAVLLGQFPQDLSAELNAPSVLPQPPDNIAPGLPIDLLRRRPDIRQAERQLAAATARIGVATANLFPTVLLTGGLGMQGQGLGVTPAVNKFIWSIGPTAYWPLLDFGTLDALIEIQDLRTHEQLVNYKRIVLSAVEEADDAIANFSAQQDHLRGLGDALAAAQRAVEVASQRYNRGFTGYLDVLDAQRELYSLQNQYLQGQEQVALQYVALYQSLGGGWENYQNIPPIHQPQPAIVATFQRIISPDSAR